MRAFSMFERKTLKLLVLYNILMLRNIGIIHSDCTAFIMQSSDDSWNVFGTIDLLLGTLKKSTEEAKTKTIRCSEIKKKINNQRVDRWTMELCTRRPCNNVIIHVVLLLYSTYTYNLYIYIIVILYALIWHLKDGYGFFPFNKRYSQQKLYTFILSWYN